ncbi:kinesin-like protein KIF14 [Ascaphus truei]|uniref:kinesin-like protein KIF14 n=1 Tax=Ascaphus truei TaxID=8439 RepID=UPI003F590289
MPAPKMSIYTNPTKSHPSMYGISSTERGDALQRNAKVTTSGNHLGTHASGSVTDSQKSLSSHKTSDVNRTYVISTCNNVAVPAVAPRQVGKLTLQRRRTGSKESPRVEKGPGEDMTQRGASEKRLTLQRRQRTGSVDMGDTERIAEIGGKANHSTGQQHGKCGLPPTVGCKIGNEELCEVARGSVARVEPKAKDSCGVNGKSSYSKLSVNGVKPQHVHEVGRSEDPSTVQAARGSVGTGGNDKSSCLRKTPVAKHGSPDRQRTPRSGASGVARSLSFRDSRSLAATQKRPPVGITPAAQKKAPATARTLFAGRTERTREVSLSSDIGHAKDEAVALQPNSEDEPLKEENCAVTVAVRVRPFSNRERNEMASQVVFMSGQETTVQNPDSKQTHSFLYDFSFWSFDKSNPDYAGQESVYEKLAVPLLERSLLGYNTCLFAYGQTGSGKSYTMMGFDEELGVIPRFCDDLFSRIYTADKQQGAYHLEMSYFEVYNEKIHDLLVFRGDHGQKKQPLRVREHPLLGPYVEDLSANVVSTYEDIQSWLELGSRQRATAATGMNDKSSRSHSVFTLVMTQTKTEYVEGEEHDRRISSRINLVDLAGSERCSSAQTSGERLKEGVSINKSLLTLGKVISALSENAQTRKNLFIPYRESVLTWLLKESLGGNSKTTMIATISAADCHMEETLSTLRYARQARLIINIAKVNEDINAKLIRELKTEIEKLKASQLSAQNTDCEKYRRYQQEMSSLKLKLNQQEQEMIVMRRAWKDKLEQAEQRKREETEELRKAGITLKMDNRLPNLVNLNEDPQLSEVLLYMIKEGQTTVGMSSPGSGHDIQLSGALIAEDHCVITNIENAVSLTPSGDAKTYVNGDQISASTVLHHGDRVILGGGHYFRFNHPVEVPGLKARSHVSTSSAEGPKDFEFAKNELLATQRSQLEAEIEEARLRAKADMMRGIQIAEEMAAQELTSQRSAYEKKIQALEAELKEESRRKQLQERSTQQAASKIEELEEVKMHLQQEVTLNKRRLQMETLATRQELEDHTMRHAKILVALEAEKQKIAKEVQVLQDERSSRNKGTAAQPTWTSMKLSVMIQEANTISSKLRKHTVFSRHYVTDKENVCGAPVQILLRNTKLGIETLWGLEKFEYKLAAMKELYESNGDLKDDDVFYDPADEWEADLSTSSVSSFSRRRSKSLMKNRRLSGCLYEIRAHPIQSLQSGHTSGLMNRSSSTSSSNLPESHLPGICKDLIGSALDYLGRSLTDENNMADSLISGLHAICSGVRAVSQEYEQQDEESADMLFSVNRAAQSHSVGLTSAFQQLVVLTKHWLDGVPENQEATKPADALRLCIRKLGGYLQLLLQGCCSDIPSMVTEAKGQAGQAAAQAVQTIGHLAAVTGIGLHRPRQDSKDGHSLQGCCSDIPSMVTEAKGQAGQAAAQAVQTIGHLAAVTGIGLHRPRQDSKDGHSLQSSFSRTLCDGARMGLESLLDSGMKTSEEMQKDFLNFSAHNEVPVGIRKNAVTFAAFLQNSLIRCKQLDLNSLFKESDITTGSQLAAELRALIRGLGQLRQNVLSALKGSGSDGPALLMALDGISASASLINKNLSVFAPQIINLSELRSAAETLKLSLQGTQGDISSHGGFPDKGAGPRDRAGLSKHIQVLNTQSHLAFSPTAIQWV